MALKNRVVLEKSKYLGQRPKPQAKKYLFLRKGHSRTSPPYVVISFKSLKCAVSLPPPS